MREVCNTDIGWSGINAAPSSLVSRSFSLGVEADLDAGVGAVGEASAKLKLSGSIKLSGEFDKHSVDIINNPMDITAQYQLRPSFKFSYSASGAVGVGIILRTEDERNFNKIMPVRTGEMNPDGVDRVNPEPFYQNMAPAM